MKRPIFVLTGTPASGKSTVGKALLKRFSFGFQIPVDTLRNMVVSGLSDPIGSWDDETERQFRLARRSAAQMARIYASAGFAVVIDDVIFPDQVEATYEAIFANDAWYKVMLRPSLAVAIERNRKRATSENERLLEQIIEPMYDHFASYDLDDGWCVVDSSELTVEETVDEILVRLGCFPR